MTLTGHDTKTQACNATYKSYPVLGDEDDQAKKPHYADRNDSTVDDRFIPPGHIVDESAVQIVRPSGPETLPKVQEIRQSPPDLAPV